VSDTKTKRIWRDGASQRAKCPKCGRVGLRTMLSNGKAWEFHHGRIPGPIGPQAIICFVAVKAL
jgi:hypothetical protein